MSITPADIESAIASEHYISPGRYWLLAGNSGPVPLPLDLLTICVLVTTNGHTVTGESHCQDPAKFNAQIGRDEARKVAIKNLWPMVVYAEREKAAVSVTQSIAYRSAEAINAINKACP